MLMVVVRCRQYISAKTLHDMEMRVAELSVRVLLFENFEYVERFLRRSNIPQFKLSSARAVAVRGLRIRTRQQQTLFPLLLPRRRPLLAAAHHKTAAAASQRTFPIMRATSIEQSNLFLSKQF